MKNINRKAISFILAIAMMISLIPSNLFVFATDETTTDTTSYGEVTAALNTESSFILYTQGAETAETTIVSSEVDRGLFPTKVKIVDYYGDFSTSFRAYKVEPLEGTWPEAYANYTWVRYIDLSNFEQEPIAEDEEMIGKSFYINPPLYDSDGYYEMLNLYETPDISPNDSFILESSDYMAVYTITDVFKTAWCELYQLTSGDSEIKVWADGLWISASDVEIITADTPIRGQVAVTQFGEPVSEIYLTPGEKSYVFTELGNQIDNAVSYQWQVLIDEENNIWADIYDYIHPYAVLSEALIGNVLNELNCVNMRCVVTSKTGTYVSGGFYVWWEDDTAEIFAMDDVVAENDAATVATDTTDSTTGFELRINYVLLHGSNAEVVTDTIKYAPPIPFVRTFQTSTGYTATIDSPYKVGYKPYRAITEEDYNQRYEQGNTTVIKFESYSYTEGGIDKQVFYLEEAPSEVFTGATSNETRTVYYVPQNVQYTVNYYHQNIYDDEYSFFKSVLREGLADALVDANLAENEIGFSVLGYDTSLTIQPNNTTIVDIYYDRDYFLVKFELGEGYGVNPFYVRYGTQIMIGTPTNPGYDFAGWQLTEVETVAADGTKTSETRPDATNLDTWLKTWAKYNITTGGSYIEVGNQNLVYTAVWTAKQTTYTIIYWSENADDDNFSIWATETISNVVPGTVVDCTRFHISEELATNSEGLDERRFFSRNNDRSDQTITINGEGTTVANIYYNRNEYTLKFYYAMADVTNPNTPSYYVVGGSTYYFGASANIADKSNEVELLKQYVTNYTSEIGKIKALPSYDKEKYGQLAYDSTTTGWGARQKNYNFYYISFKAKYGSDISDLWPCGVLSQVERTDKDNTNKFDSNYAYVSAWNGEHHVYYSQKNKNNQTIKGKYQILDHTLLWDKNFGESNTVTYLCYWLNGANVSWSIPSRFQYNIWLPTLEGVDYSQKITTRDGTQYYLESQYDTYDNFDYSRDGNDPSIGQIHPSIEGYTANDKTYLDLKTESPSYQGEYEINFYYTRNAKNLYISSAGSSLLILEDIPYEQSLSSYLYNGTDTLATYTPPLPSVYENGSVNFAGWYTTEQCATGTEYNLSTATMPNSDVYLYAKWVRTTWSVEVYLDTNDDGTPKTLVEDYSGNYEAKENDENKPAYPSGIPFGTIISEPTAALAQAKQSDAYKNLKWAGWYYKDSDGEEHRFDFNTMQIKNNYIVNGNEDDNFAIYGKWSDQVPVEYVINYVIEGTATQVAETTKGNALVGIAKTFYAKASKELYDAYQTRYFPTERSTMMKMNSDSGMNVYTFQYVQQESASYTIKHTFESSEFERVLGTGNTTVTLEIPSNATSHSMISVQFTAGVTPTAKYTYGNRVSVEDTQLAGVWKVIETLSPDAYSKDLILLAGNDADNEVEFFWNNRGSSVVYEVVHYTENLDGTYSTYLTQYYEAEAGTVVSATNITIAGFSFNDVVGGTFVSGTVTKPTYENGSYTGGLTLKLYYTRDTYSYIVKHLMAGQTSPILTEKYDGTTTDHPKAKYGETITITALTERADGKDQMNGYYCTTPSQSVEIVAEGQIISFYYDAMIINFAYIAQTGGEVTSSNEIFYMSSDAPVGSEAIAEQGYDFVGWYDANDNLISTSAQWAPRKPTANIENGITIRYYAKFKLGVSSLTIKVDGTIPETDQGFIYTIKGTGTNSSSVSMRVCVIGKGSVTITNLPIDSYTVTWEKAWSWRYNDQNQTALNEQNITLTTTAAENVVTFTYSTPNDKWLSDNAVYPFVDAVNP